jgi:hypothetical protein
MSIDFPAYAAWARGWTRWAREHDVPLETATRRVSGTEQSLPLAVHLPDLATAVRVLGAPWPERVSRAEDRARQISERFPQVDTATLTAVIRTITDWNELDVTLMCAAASWFAENDGAGRTPRQVPIPGMHAKWLNTHQSQVLALSGRASLNLAPGHPPRVHFNYLDPDHLERGGRRHDSHTLGDAFTPAYNPHVVLICENKDSVVTFPAMAGAIAVEGNGRGVGAIPSLPWVQTAAHLLYWGDMDADGLEILAEFRAAGLQVTSVLMDLSAYEAWARYGTDHDRFGKVLKPRPPRAGLDLQPAERALYELLCDPRCPTFRRVEQERVPLEVAWDHVDASVRAAT